MVVRVDVGAWWARGLRRAFGLAMATMVLASGAGCASKPKPEEASSVAHEQLPLLPLNFALDPLDDTKPPVSERLRGRRALVLVLASFDIGSLAALRLLAPMLQKLPDDASCLLVALEPMDDRVLVEQFFQSVPTPCRKAIGDPARGKLGDLAQVRVLPSVLSLRRDGTLAGVVAGNFQEADVERIFRSSGP